MHCITKYIARDHDDGRFRMVVDENGLWVKTADHMLYMEAATKRAAEAVEVIANLRSECRDLQEQLEACQNPALTNIDDQGLELALVILNQHLQAAEGVKLLIGKGGRIRLWKRAE